MNKKIHTHYVVFLLMASLLILWICNSIHLMETSTECITIADADQDAYNLLSKTEVFANAPTSFDGSMIEEIKAFRALFYSNNAKNYFLKLENEGTNEAKLYALCGLYFLDHDNYSNWIRKYQFSDEPVNYFFGCMLGRFKMKELIKCNWPNETGLTDKNKMLEQWFERNPVFSIEFDFYGGGIPSSLFGYMNG